MRAGWLFLICAGCRVKPAFNGVMVHKGRGADPPGYICLQSEGWPVFYRNVQIKVLPD